MIRHLAAASAVICLAAGTALAQGDMMGDPPPGPEVVLAPPEGFMPPPDLPPPPPPTGDPEMDKGPMAEHFFRLVDANRDGVIDLFEFQSWVRRVHLPPPDMMEGDGMMGDPMMEDGGMMMDGVLKAGEGDLAGLHMAPECSDELRESEQLPQAENVPCGDREGNLVFRTICNMPGYDMVAISLPENRAAGCFGLEALRGAIGFEIVTEDGMHVWDTTMGKDSFRALKLDGPGIYHVRSTGGSPDGAVTVRFVDVPTGM